MILPRDYRLLGLTTRSYSCDEFDDNCYYYNSGWDNWGRWVVLVAIVVAFFLLFFICACITSRRRRRNGLSPYRGTGWLAGKTPPGHNPATYNGGYYGQNAPYGGAAPAYATPQEPQYTGHTFNSNEGYYGQQNGVELQQPSSAYQPQRGGDPVYESPSGPPPNKGGDGIIR